jgi:drug/metabolite transporter (DMT)-like permease
LKARQLGFIQIIFSGICFGFLGYFGKIAYLEKVTPGELLSLRFSVAAILFLILLVLQKQKPWSLSGKSFLLCLALGVFGYAVFSSFFFYALKGLSASLTVLLLYTYPAMVAIASQFFLRQRLGRQGWVALALCFLGMIGLVWGEWQVSEGRYLLFGLGSALFYALYILFSERWLKGIPASLSTFYITLGAGLSLSLFHFSSWQRPLEILDQSPWLIFATAFLCSVVAMGFFQAGLQKIKSAEVSMLSTTEPLSGVLIASLFLGEKIQAAQWIGAALVLSALVILAKAKRSFGGDI